MGKKSKKILVGLSGGVDSAVAAYLLIRDGYDVTAGFMINYLAPEGEFCSTKEDLAIAKEVARFLDIPFFTFDYRNSYEKKVLDYMYDGYKKGITPNPDMMCNSEIKFKLFLEEALEHNFDGIAMGHYARIEKRAIENMTTFHLLKGKDEMKDQSYFLAGLDQYQLSKTFFPLGEMKKSQVRTLAEKIGLPNAKRKDSQGICFVGKVNISEFLEKKIQPKKGLVKDTSGNILGEHKGVFYYTIGQRKGLNIGGQSQPIFIIRKDIEKNELIVGTNDDLELFSDILFFHHVHFLSGNRFEFPLKAQAKIRYRQKDQNCEVFAPISNTIYWKVSFQQQQRAIASGQICAIYIGDELIMSGVIL